MNKKLFSWKALAGLALLVAMGLTSCKQSTEVDPNDPYNTTKPVKPGTSTAGDADLTFTITNATGGDLATLWANWKKDNKDAAAELMAKDEVTIALNFANYKLDGAEIAIPQFVATPKGSIINIIVSDFAEAKKALNLNTKNLSGAEVNFFLPSATFEMALTADNVIATLASVGTTELTKLTAKANTGKNALDIADGVTVDGITMTSGDVTVASAENIIAKLVGAAGENLEEGKAGARIGSLDAFVKNLIITADATVNGADKVALETVTVNESTTLTLGAKKSKIDNIVGLGSAKKKSVVAFAGDKDDFSNIKSMTNVYLKGTTATNVDDFDIFENVVFNIPVNLLSEGAANTEFNDDVNVTIVDGVEEVAFANVNFGKNSSINMGYDTKKVVGKKKVLALYEANAATGKYEAVEDNDEENLTAANAKKDGASYVTADYSTWNQIKTAKITFDNVKFHFVAIESAQDDLTAATKAYDAICKTDGYDYVNAKGTAAYKKAVDDYQDAWEKLNGTAKVTIESGKAIKFEVIAKADRTATYVTGLYEDYATEWKFVTGANAAIKDSYWFTIYYAKETSYEPDLVKVTFDADCTFNGKELDVDIFNQLFGTPESFYSIEDAWYKVYYDGEAFAWKKASGGYILK